MEKPKRSTAAKPKASAATHRPTKNTAAGPAVLTKDSTEAVRPVSHNDIACLAYSIWETRGCPGGSAEQDWFEAERVLFELSQNG